MNTSIGRLFAGLVLASATGSAFPGEPGWVMIPPDAKVGDFARICDTHPGAANLNVRLSACGSYLIAATRQVALGRKHPSCWDELNTGKASPLVLINTMVRLGKDPEEAKQAADWTIRELVMIAAPACRH